MSAGEVVRIVLTALPAYSHVVPLVLPVGRLLQRAGHDVVVATGAAAVEHVERAGLATVVLPGALTIGEVVREKGLAEGSGMAETLRKRPGSATIAVSPQQFARLFLGVLGRRFGVDLVPVLQQRRANLVLREATEYGGYLAAEHCGVPQATLDIGPMAPYGHPAVLAELNVQRRHFGLPDVSDAWHPMRTLRACVLPEVFYPPHDRLPESRYYRPPSDPDAEALDAAIAELRDDRPLVLASLGSVVPMLLGEHSSLLDVVIEALSGLPVTGVVALGAGRDPHRWHGTRAANVHLTSFVQQKTLLPACDVFITHGGFNSTVEALSPGVPMVALPVFAEQPANAARVEELGAGVRLAIDDLTPAALRSAVMRVLDEPAFRARARGMQRRILALPPLPSIVPDLTRLAGSTPVRG